MADQDTINAYVADLHNLLSESELSQKKAFIRSFVKELIVTGNEVRLIYTMPALEINEPEESVLSTVRNGGRHRIRTYDLLRVKQML